MSFKDILVHIDSTSASNVRLKLAIDLARRFDAHLSGLHVIPEVDVPPYFKPSVVERIAEIYAENAREAAGWAETAFHDGTKETSVATSWECVSGRMEDRIAERARLADLLILGQFDTENPPTISAFLLPAKVVFGAATPVLVVPNKAISGLGRSAVIAWDGSREAARATRDAMPFLQTADRVSVIAVDPLRQGHIHDGAHTAELINHLHHHGVRAVSTESVAGGTTIAEALLAHSADFGADLLVMGAYGHSRIWEFIVGGTTQDLLELMTIPVLISR